MKKLSMNMAAIVLPLFFVALFTSCKKETGSFQSGPGHNYELNVTAGEVENMKRVKDVPFTVNLDTWYRFAPSNETTRKFKGTTYYIMGYFPGGGEGTVSVLGNAKNLFNQLAYSDAPVTPTSTPVGSFNAPAIDALNYPVTGAPLPLIQNGDFNALSAYHQSYNFPAKYHGKTVNSILFNDDGDAIYTSAVEGVGGTQLSYPIVSFWGKGLIVGGRGQFSNAKGEFNFSGTFSLANPDDATYTAQGTISY